MTRSLTVQEETAQERARRPAVPDVPPSLSLAQSVGNQAFGAILRSVRSGTAAPLAAAPVARLDDAVLSRGLARSADHRNADARSAGGEVAAEDELVDARSVGGEVAAEDDLVDARGGMLLRNGTDGGTATASPGTDAGAPGADGGTGASGAGGTAALAVTLPPTVRFPGTPAGMPDRIPPNKDFAVAVGIAGWGPPMAPVTVTVEGSGAANGTATINGAASADLSAGATVQLRGTAQTAPGDGGHLRIVARLGTTVL